jgi:hypothetical protein
MSTLSSRMPEAKVASVGELPAAQIPTEKVGDAELPFVAFPSKVPSLNDK